MSILTKIKEHIASKSKKNSMDQSLKAFLEKEIATDNIVKMTTTSKDTKDGNEYYYTTEDYFFFYDLSVNKTNPDTRVIKLSGENCGQQFNYIISGQSVIIDIGDNVKYYVNRDKVKPVSKGTQPSTIRIKDVYKSAIKTNQASKRLAYERRFARAFGEKNIN